MQRYFPEALSYSFCSIELKGLKGKYKRSLTTKHETTFELIFLVSLLFNGLFPIPAYCVAILGAFGSSVPLPAKYSCLVSFNIS